MKFTNFKIKFDHSFSKLILSYFRLYTPILVSVKIIIDYFMLQEDAISDLDDDSMFKLDDALAQAFKSMVKNKKNSKEEKEKKQQLKTFKLK